MLNSIGGNRTSGIVANRLAIGGSSGTTSQPTILDPKYNEPVLDPKNNAPDSDPKVAS